MKLKMVVELDYDAELMHSGDRDAESKQWFYLKVLLDPDDGCGLMLHSNEIGDIVGVLRVIEFKPGRREGK
jgi:hypothetical protein